MKGKRKSKYPPYAQARQQALELQLNSRNAYIAWHTDSKCQYLPRYPERVYKEWVSWNDWLGTANVFRGDLLQLPPLRDFWEAVKFSQQYCADNDINTMAEWIQHCRGDNDLPEDIPHHPDNRYDEFKAVGWKTWLGNDVRGRLTAAKHSTALMAICSYHSLSKPGNVYAVVNADAGEAEMRNHLNRHPQLVCIRCWKVDADSKEAVMDALNHFGRNDGDGWYILNVNDLIFELDNIVTPFVGT